MPRMTLELDEADFGTIQAELTLRQCRGRTRDGVVLPDSDSCLAGTMLAEVIRDLNEYRDLYAGDRES